MDPKSKPEGGGGGGSVDVETVPRSDAAPPIQTLQTQLQLFSFILRSVAIITTFIATVVMGANKESRSISVGGFSAAKKTYKAVGNNHSQLEYFIAANALAFIYASASLGLSLLKRHSPAKNLVLILCIVDILMLALLFSGIGAASAIGVFYRQKDYGGIHICDIYSKFCGGITGSIIMSMFGSLAYLAVVFVNLIGLHNKCL